MSFFENDENDAVILAEYEAEQKAKLDEFLKPVPEGIYEVILDRNTRTVNGQVIDSTILKTENGTSVNLMAHIINGEYKGKKIKHFMWIEAPAGHKSAGFALQQKKLLGTIYQIMHKKPYMDGELDIKKFFDIPIRVQVKHKEEVINYGDDEGKKRIVAKIITFLDSDESSQSEFKFE